MQCQTENKEEQVIVKNNPLKPQNIKNITNLCLMSNIEKVKNGNELNKLIETSQDKLVILFLLNSTDVNSKYAKRACESAANKHSNSLFIEINITEFSGDCIYFNIKLIVSVPFFQFMYQNTPIGSYNGRDGYELDKNIVAALQYVGSMARQRAPNQWPQQNTYNQNGFAHDNNKYMEFQQMILNQCKQNPQYYNRLMQDQQLLHQTTIQLMSQSQSQSQSQSPAPQPQPSQHFNPQPTYPQPQLMQKEINNIIVPSFSQMQQMFQIWETMHQMGILNTTVPPKQTTAPTKPTEETILPNGDKIIPMGDGKYGLIRKNASL